MLRVRTSMMVLAVAALAVVLSACGSPTPTSTPIPSATTPPTTAAPTTAAPTTQAPTAAATAAAVVATTAAPTAAATQAQTVAATAAATQVATAAATKAAAALVATSAATQAVAIVPTSTTAAATTAAPTVAPATTAAPTTAAPTVAPATTVAATAAATTAAPTVAPATTAAPTAAATAVATTAATKAAAAATAAPTSAAVSAATAAAQETAVASKPSTLPQCATGSILKVGTDATYPPFENVGSDGRITGFDVDLLTAIGNKEGFTSEFHNALFDTIFTALSYGQYDVVISASTITAPRQQTVNFSNPYFSAGQVIVVRKADASKVAVPADLAGKIIGVQKGTTGADAAKGIKDVKSVKEYDTAPEAFQALASGDVDAVVNDIVTSISIIANTPSLNEVVVGGPFTQEFYGIAVRKDCTDLLQKINTGLAAVIADGTYQALYETYFGESPVDAFKKGGAGVILTPFPAPTAAATTAASTSSSAATAAATTAASSSSSSAATPAATSGS